MFSYIDKKKILYVYSNVIYNDFILICLIKKSTFFSHVKILTRRDILERDYLILLMFNYIKQFKKNYYLLTKAIE